MPTECENYLTPEDREGFGQTTYKRFLAYRTLGIRPQDVEIVPLFRAQLTSLSRIVARERRMGEQPRPRVGPFFYLEYSPDPDARKVLAAWDSVPASYRRLLPPEAFCHAAGVSPRRVIEIIARVAVWEGAQIAAVRASLGQQRLLQKTVERGLQPDGWRDRLMFCKATGLLPSWGWRGWLTPEPDPSNDPPE
jgi:hypothetical protein